MDAHVTSTDFLPGVEVGLFPILQHPSGPGDKPASKAKVPENGQVIFKVDEPGVRYWIAGEDIDGRFKVVQAHAKPGEPVDVRATLAATLPPEPADAAERIVHGQRTTANRRPRPKSTPKAKSTSPAPKSRPKSKRTAATAKAKTKTTRS